METKKTQSYYERRLEYIIELFKSHRGDLINENQKIVKSLISEYKNKFHNKPDYDKDSIGVIENLILN